MSDNSYQQAKTQLESIVALVNALDTDFDRLEELRTRSQNLLNAVNLDDQYDIEYYAMSEDDFKELEELEDQSCDYDSQDAVLEAIRQDPLAISVHSGWANVGDELTPDEFMILLCAGGPAVRIVGELNRGQPCRARIEHQDWFEPWRDYVEPGTQDALLTYCSQFYFGE